MAVSSRTSLRVDRLRALNAPRRIDVEVDGRGAPHVIALKPADDGDEKRWRVEAVGEVWRVDDEWWRQSINRQYFEVVLEGGKHTVVFQDLANGHWFIQNI